MSDKPTGEWTTKFVHELMNGIGADARIADAHNAALAAHKQQAESMLATSKRVNDKLRKQLAAEQEKVESAERNCDSLASEKHRKSMEIKQLRSQLAAAQATIVKTV